MDERRQFPRWPIRKETKVWRSRQGFSNCFIEDIHLKGMCVSFDEQLPQQEPLRMSFAIGDSIDFVKIEAQIPWQKLEHGQYRYVYGLSFTKIMDYDKDRLSSYINANCED